MAEPVDPKEAARQERVRRYTSRLREAPPSESEHLDLLVPQVPVQEQPDVKRAARELRAGALEAYKMGDPSAASDLRARELVQRVENRPQDIPRQPTVAQSVGRAVLPKRLSTDERPASVGELVQAAGENIPDYLYDLATAGPQLGLTAADATAKLLGTESVVPPWLADRARNPFTSEEEAGTPQENGALHLLRVLGTAAPAFVQETASRLPAPNVEGAVSSGDISRFFEMSSVGRQLTGFEPGSLQRIRRTNPVADWIQGWSERVEEGRGLEEDLALSAKLRLGSDWEDTGWWVGLALDTLTDWEGAVASGPAVLARMKQSADALGELVPKQLASPSRLLIDAIKGNELRVGDWAGEASAKEVVAGRMTAEDLPAGVRAHAEQLSQAEEGLSFRELQYTEGLGPKPEVSDPEFAQIAAELKEARQQVRPARLEAEERAAKAAEKVAGKTQVTGTPPKGTPGQDPGAFAPRQKVKRKGPRDESISRPVLPDPPRAWKMKIYSAADFWRYVTRFYKSGEAVHPLGYDLPRHRGFDLLDDAASQDIADTKYAVRSATGDVLESGTYEEALEKILQRQLDGDEIWYDNRRPVARWGQRLEEGQTSIALRSDRLFASKLERAIILNLRKSKDQRVRPDALRRIKTAEEVRAAREAAAAAETAAKQTMGQVLADLLTGAPRRTTGKPKTEGKTADILRRAFALYARDLLGSDRLRQVSTGAFVAVEDHAGLLRKVDELLGITGRQLQKVLQGKAKLTPEQLKRLQSFVPDIKAETFSAKDAMKARQAAMRAAGKELVDAHHRVQGVRSLADRFIGAFKDLHTDRRKWTRMGDLLIRRGPVGWVTKAFMVDVLDRMPPRVREIWKELQLRVGRNAEDFRADVERQLAEGKHGAEEVIREVVHRYGMVVPEELEDAIRISQAPMGANKSELDALRISWSGPRPAWLDHEDEIIAVSGMRRWSRDTRAAAEQLGKDWLKAALVAAGKDVGRETDLWREIQELDGDRALALYEEFAQKGDAQGPVITAALAEQSVAKIDDKAALVTFALQVRLESIMASAISDMVREGIAVRATDPRLPALRAVMLGRHRSFNKTLKRWEYHYPEAQINWAESKLRDWAIEPGVGAATTVVRGGRGGEVVLPTFLVDEANRLIRAGLYTPQDLTPSEIANRLYAYFKESVTHGLILPNPPYFLGQMLGMLPTMVTTRGLGGTLSAMGQLLYSHPALISYLAKEMGGLGLPTYRTRAAEGDVLRTVNGDLYAGSDLADVARRFGLGETRTTFEVGDRLVDVLLRESSPIAPLERLLGTGVRWQELIRDFGGAFDLNARLAVFVDLVKGGMNPETAALQARQALLDFRDLTPFETQWMRLVVTFYAFLRKNSDAYVKALLQNPGRVLSQMRLAEASLTTSGLSSIELGAITDNDLARLTLWTDEEVVNDEGRVHPLYRMNRVSSAPLGVIEFLSIMRMMMGGDSKGVLQSLNPLAQTLAVLGLGRRLEREYDYPWANRIPPVLLDMPFLGDFMHYAFAIGPVPLTKEDDPLVADEDASKEYGAPAYWAAGGNLDLTPAQREKHRALWQTFAVWVSRPLGTVQSGAEALGLQDQPPYLTQHEATLDFLLGLKHRPVLTEPEAIRRFLRKRESELRATTRDIRPPKDLGPR